jgi:formyltetrahydrofolate deformylase
LFFQRIIFEHCSNDESSEVRKRAIDEEMKAVHDQFGFLLSEVDWMERRKRVAVMVSKYDHCLWELLLRHRANELNCDIPIVLSNHETCQEVADTFKIPYTVIPKTAADKEEQEEKELRLLQSLGIDVVVLARYMQKLSHKFLQQFPSRIINIHHSFLPAFSGGRAYHQAHERGVKLIGATAHYATEDLDEGPIIEQDVIRVSHRDETRDFVRKGRMLERGVLVRALQAHLDNRVAVYGNKCVVFSD